MAKTIRSNQPRYDQFPNFYKAIAATSVADTLAFSEWLSGYSIKDGWGFIIHKINYRLSTAILSALNADADYVGAGLVTNNTLTAAQMLTGLADNILDSTIVQKNLATAVGFIVHELEVEHDFTNEPGGGRIVAPKPLYLACWSNGVGATISIYMRICYTMIKLSQETYRELYESMNPSA